MENSFIDVGGNVFSLSTKSIIDVLQNSNVASRLAIDKFLLLVFVLFPHLLVGKNQSSKRQSNNQSKLNRINQIIDLLIVFLRSSFRGDSLKSNSRISTKQTFINHFEKDGWIISFFFVWSTSSHCYCPGFDDVLANKIQDIQAWIEILKSIH